MVEEIEAMWKTIRTFGVFFEIFGIFFEFLFFLWIYFHTVMIFLGFRVPFICWMGEQVFRLFVLR